MLRGFLDLLQRFDLRAGSDIDAELLGLAQYVAAARKLTHDDPHAIAHDLWHHVVVRIRIPSHGGDVYAALVGKRTTADVGHVMIRRDVGDLGDEVGQFAQLAKSAFGHAP